jgi:hypothetical protein
MNGLVNLVDGERSTLNMNLISTMDVPGAVLVLGAYLESCFMSRISERTAVHRRRHKGQLEDEPDVHEHDG